ncbi:MAG TPA: RidA family protein [Bryobacteraceae bacterium]|nr:RidA family protein [Bryobacteraceae bacterium]
MKRVLTIALILLLAALAAAVAKTDKKNVSVHQTAYGKFIQVGSTYYSSGIAARMPDGSVPPGMAAQTRVTLEKFQKAYAELGLKMSDVVKVNVYITDEKLKPEMDAEYQKVFSGENAPCRTAVTVASLDPGRVVEMDMIAIK